MIVTLDGGRLDKDFPAGCSLQSLIDGVRDELPDGHLVVSIAVNGQLRSESELATTFAEPLAPGDQVDLESDDRRAVCAAALRGIAAELDEAGRIQPEIAEQLNAGQVAEAVGRVGEFVHTWQACRDGVVQCSGLLGRDLTKEEFDDRTVEEHLADLVERLREIRDALDARDMVLLADLMHYELPGLCATWRSLLLSLADGIAADA